MSGVWLGRNHPPTPRRAVAARMLQIKDLGGTAGIMRSVGDKEVKMKRGVLEAWSVDAADWPREGSAEEKLRFLVRYAILAPSGHNTQARMCQRG